MTKSIFRKQDQKIDLTEEQIKAYVKAISSVDDLLKLHPANIELKKTYASVSSWKTSVAGAISTNSRTSLFLALEKKLFNRAYCLRCKTRLDDSMFMQQPWPNYGWKKSCSKKCTYLKIVQNRPADMGEKISAAKLKFFQTTEGKKVAKSVGLQNSISMKMYAADPNTLNARKSAGAKRSVTVKNKILSGEFSPPLHNRWTSWISTITINEKVKKFRSSWDACFWFCNQHLEYETLRIPYFKLNEQKVYIADFYDKHTNTLYELKPKSIMLKEKDKINHVINHCNINKINFIWINEDNLMNYIDAVKISENSSANIQFKKVCKNVK
jgi:hypothetical protein